MTLFVTFRSRFMENAHSRERFLSFFLFLNSPSEFNYRKIRQHLTNCENWNNRDKV